MTIKNISEFPVGKLDIDLTGPTGNAFHLIGIAADLSKQLGLDFNDIQADMTSGDYEHLIDVFEKNFGKHVTLYR